MAIPSSGYSTADFTNPASDLTDFVAVVDLADMPADFWTAVSSSDGARGRVAKDDGTTELASEWVEFDDVAETGFVFFKWSGTLSSTGTSTVRIYPPQSGNSSYGVTATFGRNAVWSEAPAMFHKNESSGSTATNSSGVTDGTYTGNLPTSTAGFIGDGQDYTGSTDAVDVTGDVAYALSDFRVSVIFNKSGSTGESIQVMTNNNRDDSTSSANRNWWIVLDNTFADNGAVWARVGDGSTSNGIFGAKITDADYRDGANHKVDLVISETNGTAALYIDGVSKATDTFTGSVSTWSDTWAIGYEHNNDQRYFVGTLDEVRVDNTPRDSDWISLEYDNQSDPTTFWGTWTWNSTGVTLTAEQGSYTLTGQTANLLRSLILGADQGSYTLSGQAVAFLRDYVIVAEQGTYTTSGSSTTFLENEVLQASQGSYTFTGQDATLARAYFLSADQGTYTVTGQDANLLFNRVLAAQQGTYTLTGQDIGLLRNLVLQAGAGNYVLSGQNVTLTVVDVVSAEKLQLKSIISDTLVGTSTISTSLVKESNITDTLSLKSIIDD